ncbi:hypothetical protein [Mesorhizobium loti]|uniref:hypothetical protein n=1 Tax=Rhizobium loti TaxID=381 RepID=UPI0012BC6A40|nr:hypothetical protein [Mesorhizobium loti]
MRSYKDSTAMVVAVMTPILSIAVLAIIVLTVVLAVVVAPLIMMTVVVTVLAAIVRGVLVSIASAVVRLDDYALGIGRRQ